MVTIHKLLLTHANKISSRKKMSSFQGSNCTEGPAWSTGTLISQIKSNNKHECFESNSLKIKVPSPTHKIFKAMEINFILDL